MQIDELPIWRMISSALVEKNASGRKFRPVKTCALRQQASQSGRSRAKDEKDRVEENIKSQRIKKGGLIFEKYIAFDENL